VKGEKLCWAPWKDLISFNGKSILENSFYEREITGKIYNSMQRPETKIER
jgi:hypothetical protein